MSHFFTVVIVPGDTLAEQIEELVARLLAPYNENLRVDPSKVYLDDQERECMASYYHVAPHNLAELARHLEDWAGQSGGVDERGLYRWCTYNPQAKWDWWVIGGRWNGAIRAAPRHDETGFNFGEEYHQLTENMLPANQLDHTLTCFAVVTPDGIWHEQGKMGWWAVVTDEKDDAEWDKELISILQNHQDGMLVGVDCHI